MALHHRFFSAMLFLCGAGLSVSAAAEQFDNQWLLAKYDLNGDDIITQDEIAVKKSVIFRRLDRDNDGGVSFDEYETADASRRHTILKARFGKLDVNRDGVVSDEEYRNYMGMFASIDQDGDGALSTYEVSPATPQQAKDDSTRCLLWFCIKTQLD